MKHTMVALLDAREANKALLSFLKVSAAMLDITNAYYVVITCMTPK